MAITVQVTSLKLIACGLKRTKQYDKNERDWPHKNGTRFHYTVASAYVNGTGSILLDAFLGTEQHKSAVFLVISLR